MSTNKPSIGSVVLKMTLVIFEKIVNFQSFYNTLFVYYFSKYL